MITKKKTVVFIEDEPQIREPLVETLNIYGFNAIGTENISHSLELLKTHKNEISVIIADMYLKYYPDYEIYNKQRGSAVTGIDLVRDLLKEQPVQRPESIILSSIGDNYEYYRKALKAGASRYLLKGKAEDTYKIIPLTQALALKYSFQLNSTGNSEISNLVDGIANKAELLNNFCINKLIPELNLCIGEAAYLLLFRHKDKAASIHSDLIDIPQQDEFNYSELHEQIFKTVSNSTYYSGKDLDVFSDNSAEKLRDFEYLQLVKSNELEIAIGIPAQFPVKDTVREYGFTTLDLAEALIEHSKPNLGNFFEEMVSRWQEKQSVRLERLNTLLGWSNLFQTKLNNLVPKELPKTLAQAHKDFEELKNFSKEINGYNEKLSKLRDYSISVDSEANFSSTSLSEAVREIEAAYNRQGYSKEILFSLEADCLISANKYYFLQALDGLVRWAFERREKVKTDEKQTITFSYEVRENRLTIIFREKSERVHKSVRAKYLFAPMNYLNLSKLIIEYACQGKLIDATDDADEGFGHTFKIELFA